MSDATPTVLLDSCAEGAYGRSWRFSGHLGTLAAMTPQEVPVVLAQAEAAAQQGRFAVGFVAYEAAQALNPHLPSLPRTGLPLAWFALFRERQAVSSGEGLPEPGGALPVLAPLLNQEEHAAAVQRIHEAIASGESYQINYTFPLQGCFDDDPLQLYRQLLQSQRPAFGAFIHTGSHTIISASPELFFELKDGVVVTRPMKGTAVRGRHPAEDRLLARDLCRSAKERAENLMIVDLLRNDLGQVARTGTVRTELLFACESYPTVHQMTSTISARLKPGTGVVELFRALFPCGSVTGAPKRRSMELIAGLERHPRGVYCGAIGCLAPGGEAVFSVAIRTLLLDREQGTISMGVGSGVTWESDPAAEYAECLGKAAFLRQAPPPRLLESLLLDNGRYPLLDRHLDRLCWAASRLGHRCDRQAVAAELLRHGAGTTGRHKVRLLLDINGDITIESAPLVPLPQPLRLTLAAEAVDPDDPWLYLKTERRERYAVARREHPAADEVLLCNSRGELTEGTFTNLVLKLDNRLVTPPLASGLLPGVMREELLQQGVIVEQVLYPADLEKAEEIWLLNGVRGWLRGELAS
ncbi:aminodeoxychorismate synthase component I [Trichlorobacter ammonificans]|uniref:Para-aminobenzoate synthase, aminase component n=1 Tax=Trichlorobacter ammonificans TaxID=2916410 RepID=A0ABN8HBX7_9BACT|nr:aminodeoxychorismate synthase component I [Trichlorobacter ammonificans]CAH2030212.1 Para-aminobenzoate synthase, aminase component [Trichlorobacter ammonificans]